MRSLLQMAPVAIYALMALPTRAIMQDSVDIEVTKAMDCDRKTRDGDRIQVHYSGRLQTGTLFDSSYNRNEPFSFTLGAGQVIKGWDLGLLDMCPGEERRLTIPPSLAYGERRVGMIPAGATLIFDTLLVDIFELAISPDPHPSSTPLPTHESLDTSNATEDDEATQEAEDATDESGANSSLDSIYSDGSENGECRLLGPFALFVQGGLGLLAILSLVWKRYRERPRRPLLIWFFDASKQVFGSALLHVANLLMSMLPFGSSQEGYSADLMHAPMPNDKGAVPNPCSYYLINLAIDTTIGIVILVVVLRILNYAISYIADPPESIKSGNYGQPPKWKWWLKQSLIYFVALFIMKLCVFFIFTILPWIAWVGDWALRWTYGNQALQITFVMFVFPLCMNALQYYIIDGYIKDTTSREIDTPDDEGEDGDEDDEREPLHRDGSDDVDGLHGGQRHKADGQRIRTKEIGQVYDSVETESSHLGDSGGSSAEDDRK